MASKPQQEKDRKDPDYKAKGKQFVVKYLQPRWWRWNARVVITPTFRTRWETGFKIKAVSFSGRQVAEIGVSKPSWGHPGFIHFRVNFKPRQHDRFMNNSVPGVNRLKVNHSHRQHVGFAQILIAGQKKYGWKLVAVR